MSLSRVVPGLACLMGLLLCPLLARGMDYAVRPGRGLAIYLKNSFAPDSSAILFEYSTSKVFPNVTYVFTAQGQRLTVDARGGGYVLLLPYPGKGEAAPEEALAALQVADARFPQYGSQLAPLEAAWHQEEKKPRELLEQEIAARDRNRSIGESFVEWVKGLFPQRPPMVIPPSLLGPDSTDPAKDKKAAPKDDDDSVKPAATTDGDGQGETLESLLQKQQQGESEKSPDVKE